MQLTFSGYKYSTEGDNEASSSHYKAKVGNLKGAAGYHPPQRELRAGSPVCQCAECHEYFSTPSVFDRHQTAQATANPRYRSEKQMRAIGMTLNENGVWLFGISKKQAEIERLEHS